jgi:hypothetical protein
VVKPSFVVRLCNLIARRWIAKNVEAPAARFAVRRCFRLGVLGAARFEQSVASLHALDSLAHILERSELSLDAYAVARIEDENR